MSRTQMPIVGWISEALEKTAKAARTVWPEGSANTADAIANPSPYVDLAVVWTIRVVDINQLLALLNETCLVIGRQDATYPERVEERRGEFSFYDTNTQIYTEKDEAVGTMHAFQRKVVLHPKSQTICNVKTRLETTIVNHAPVMTDRAPALRRVVLKHALHYSPVGKPAFFATTSTTTSAMGALAQDQQQQEQEPKQPWMYSVVVTWSQQSRAMPDTASIRDLLDEGEHTHRQAQNMTEPTTAILRLARVADEPSGWESWFDAECRNKIASEMVERIEELMTACEQRGIILL